MSEWMSDWRKEKKEETGREGVDRRKKGRREPSFLFRASCDLEEGGNWGGCLLASHVPVTRTVPGREALAQGAAKWLVCTPFYFSFLILSFSICSLGMASASHLEWFGGGAADAHMPVGSALWPR